MHRGYRSVLRSVLSKGIGVSKDSAQVRVRACSRCEALKGSQCNWSIVNQMRWDHRGRQEPDHVGLWRAMVRMCDFILWKFILQWKHSSYLWTQYYRGMWMKSRISSKISAVVQERDGAWTRMVVWRWREVDGFQIHFDIDGIWRMRKREELRMAPRDVWLKQLLGWWCHGK